MRTPLLAVLTLSAVGHGTPRRAEPPMARANDYTHSAGTLRNGVLSVRLVAQVGRWRPEAETGAVLAADMFGEEGLPPSVPGPMLRAKVGTRVEATIRNALGDTLRVLGLNERSAGVEDTLRIAPGRTGRASFVINSVGAYVWAGDVVHDGKVIEGGRGTQLAGLIVGDSSDTPPRERVAVITFWNQLNDSTNPKAGERYLFLWNGKLWPHTERFTYTVGDTVRWRVVDASYNAHPMHLHGFYFRVDSRGTYERDTIYTAAQRRMAVTETTPPFGNFTITWVPERPGNWVFHCHKPAHTTYAMRHMASGHEVDPVDAREEMRHDEPHALTGMSGLVVGITVRPRDAMVAQQAIEEPQRVRVLAQERAAFYGKREGFGYVIADGTPPAADSIRVPGAPIVVTRGRPAEVTVVNRLREPTSVHWHGIELESYYDGVAGWSGAGTRLAPIIAPHDSFTARFTPPRAGTFMYHTHVDDIRQLARGLYGPLIVLEPGQRWDPKTDHPLMIGPAFENARYVVALNGSMTPPDLELRAGAHHRLRLMNLTVDEDATVSLYTSVTGADSTLATWRAIAKDGADLPTSTSTERPARVFISPGETYDFEIIPSPGEMRLVVQAPTPVVMRLRAR